MHGWGYNGATADEHTALPAPSRVHPHGLRRSNAFEMAQEGIPLHVVQKQLGHTSLATTQTEIDHLGVDGHIEIVSSRSAG